MTAPNPEVTERIIRATWKDDTLSVNFDVTDGGKMENLRVRSMNGTTDLGAFRNFPLEELAEFAWKHQAIVTVNAGTYKKPGRNPSA